MSRLMEINQFINTIVWGLPMLFLFIGTGVYLTIKTNFFTIEKLGYILKSTIGSVFKRQNKDKSSQGEITAFQAVSTALAATVGTGNIAGVATAITLGGPGSILWMILSAFVGMATKFGEVVLSIHYREKTPDGRYLGGPMYYIEKGMRMKWLSKIFALLGALCAFGIGNMVQSNSVAASLEVSFGISKLITGIVLAFFVGLVVIGGIKRISRVTEFVVPFMALFYIIGVLIVIIANASKIPESIGLIISSAFTGHAAVGGFAGATVAQSIRMGVSRGVFTNEAGLGSAPIAHAAATTDHPVRQGLWGVFEVFADTIVICTLTALAIITTGVWQSTETGAAMTTLAFEQVMPKAGGYVVSFAIVMFAFATILGWEFYGEKCAEYIFGKRSNFIYKLIFVPFVIIGALGGLEDLWDLADTLNGLMALPNLIAILVMSGTIFKLTKDFFSNQYMREKKLKKKFRLF